ncbi:MAG: S4 domain-containing protein [Bacteroidota bacterium]
MEIASVDKVRVDKWLWAVRIFKTRSKAADECRTGHVKMNGKSLKPSHLLSGQETIQVKRNGFNMVYHVKILIAKRVGAPIAITCYDDLTPTDELNKYKDWFIGKAKGEFREKGEGRPTKKQRREIDEYKINAYLDEEEEFD